MRDVPNAVGLGALLIVLAMLGVRLYLASREDRLLAHLHRRLQEMQRERELKKLELAQARQESQNAKSQPSSEG